MFFFPETGSAPTQPATTSFATDYSGAGLLDSDPARHHVFRYPLLGAGLLRFLAHAGGGDPALRRGVEEVNQEGPRPQPDDYSACAAPELPHRLISCSENHGTSRLDSTIIPARYRC